MTPQPTQFSRPAGFRARPLWPAWLPVIAAALALWFGAVTFAQSQPSNALPNVVTPLGTNSVDLLDDKYRLVIGDQLSYRVIEDEEDPKTLVITDSGEIEVPYLGRYPASGKTCKELSAGLKSALEKKLYFQATVVVAVNAMPRSRGKIYLVGAIRSAGPQDISSEEALTISKAILRAGGFSPFANEKKVKITRTTGPGKDDKQTFVVDVSRIFEKGETESDLPLQPGDLIFIPERLIRF